MEEKSRAVLKATLALIGTIIGAGLFALPEMFRRVGFWPGSLLFWMLALLVLFTHLLYMDVILASRASHRLAGHAARWLGRPGRWIASVVYPLQIIGTDLAYLILGGEFLAVLARSFGLGGQTLAWQIIFWGLGASAVFFGLSFVAKAEAVTTWLLIGSVLFVSLVAADEASAAATVVADWSSFLLPFGVFLFSLTGISVLGEVADMVGHNRRRAFQATILGSLAAAFLGWLFGTMFALAGGHAALSADMLGRVLPPSWAWLIPVVGFLAIITSFFATAFDLKAAFHLDFGLAPSWAWASALLPPLILLLITQRNFLSVIGIVGAVFSGIIGSLIAFMAMRVLAKRRANVIWRLVLPTLVILGYLTGLVYKLVG